MKLRTALAALALASLMSTAAGQSETREFRYHAPGALTGAGERGEADRKVHFANIAFPVRFNPQTQSVVLNSQRYTPGGGCFQAPCSWSDADLGPDGAGQCSPTNYRMPWRDTFCERAGRGNRPNPMCRQDPRASHQGVDIRPPTCRRARWEAVAVDDGRIISARGHVVELQTRDGVVFVYRHLDHSSISHWSVNDAVSKGETIGRISNILKFKSDGTPELTTTHLHLEARQPEANGVRVPWPLYASLVSAYRRALGLSSGVGADGLLRQDDEREISASD